MKVPVYICMNFFPTNTFLLSLNFTLEPSIFHFQKHIFLCHLYIHIYIYLAIAFAYIDISFSIVKIGRNSIKISINVICDRVYSQILEKRLQYIYVIFIECFIQIWYKQWTCSFFLYTHGPSIYSFTLFITSFRIYFDIELIKRITFTYNESTSLNKFQNRSSNLNCLHERSLRLV